MTRQRILIIDDDQAVRDAFDIALGELYEVSLSSNGEQGVAQASLVRPDLIFLDLRMPGIDGVETLRRLHAVDASLKIYIVTAFAREYMEGLQAAKNDGMHFQLAAKPLSSQQIRMITEATLDQTQVGIST